MPFELAKMKVIGIISLCICITTSCFASEQNLYFHLHQSYSYLEAYAKSECITFPKQAKMHLILADKELKKAASLFEPELQDIWRLYNLGSQIKLQQVEQARDHVQSKADSLKLKHQKEWHDEIKECSLMSN